MNLIVVKLQDGQTELLELHPVIRAFVRATFQPAEQLSYVEAMLKSYLAFFGLHRSELARRPRAETIDRWLEAAEVCTQSRKYDQAFEWLYDVRDHVQSTGHTLEYIRIAEALARSNAWKDEDLPRYFDEVASSLIDAISVMGRQDDALSVLELYKDSIDTKNARYINYCNLMCHHYWISREYLAAIRWGVEGVELKKTTGVDTNYDASHNLALAQRDSGAVDDALAFFLKGETLSKVLEPEPPVGRRRLRVGPSDTDRVRPTSVAWLYVATDRISNDR